MRDSLLLLVVLGLFLITSTAVYLELTAPVGRDASAEVVARVLGELPKLKRRHNDSLVWERLQVGDPISNGDSIFASTGSSASIAFTDGTLLEVEENSLVVIDRTPAKMAALIRVEKGRVTARSSTAGAHLQMGATQMQLSGHAMATITSAGEGRQRVTVSRGAATVQVSDEAPTTVSANETMVIVAGGIETPSKLMAVLEEPAAHARLYRREAPASVHFTWHLPPSDTPVVFELAEDRDFVLLVRTVAVNAEAVDIEGLDPGVYHWRLRSDALGVSEERSFSLTQDRPPRPLVPFANEVVFLPEGTGRTLQWTPVSGVRRYRVEILSDRADAPEAAFAAEADGPNLRVFGGGLLEGSYRWRVRSLAEERGESPFSNALPFRLIVRPLPRTPELYPERELEDGDRSPVKPQKQGWLRQLLISEAHAAEPESPILQTLVLRWEAILGIDRYQIQISANEAFTEVVIDQQVTANYFHYPRRTPGEVWWRVRSIDADHRPGVFSKARRLPPFALMPAPLSPAVGARFTMGTSSPTILFRWQGADPPTRTQLVVAEDPEFSRVVYERAIDGTQLEWQPPGTGTYLWRVGADSGGTLTFAPARHLLVELGAPENLRDATIIFSAPPSALVLAAQPVQTALSYQVQVAASESFVRPLHQARVSAPKAAWTPSQPGVFWWRLRALGAKGEVSPWSPPRTARVDLATPVLLRPEPTKTHVMRSSTGSVELAWEPVAGAHHYDVVLAREGSIEPPTRKRHDTAAARLSALPPGSFSITVEALGASGLRSAASPAVALRVVESPPLAAPVVQRPLHGACISSNANVHLAWQPVSGALRYQIEITQAGSSVASMEQTTAEGVTELQIELPPGEYAWRVRAVDADGLNGASSDPQVLCYGLSSVHDVSVVLAPTTVRVGDLAGAELRITLTDETGRRISGVRLVTTAARGSVEGLAEGADGVYRARYRPPAEIGDGSDRLILTTATSVWRTEHAIALRVHDLLSLGASLGFSMSPSLLFSPVVALDFGVRPLSTPPFDGLVATLRVGYQYAQLGGDSEVSAMQHNIPVALGARFEVPTAWVVFHGGAALLLGVFFGQLNVMPQPQTTHIALGIGAEASAGAGTEVGPGVAFFEARFGWLRQNGGAFAFDGSGLVLALGYRANL